MKKIILALCVTATAVSCTTEPGDIPANGPVGVSFTDTDTNITFGGPITITRAPDESDITAYRIKWGGTGSCIPIGNTIGQVDTSGSGDIVFQMPSGTTKPIAADKILVFSANGVGENLACASVQVINDDSTAVPPSNPPTGISFTDTDGEDTIGGTVTISPANIQIDITDYVLRFGNGGCNVANGFIAEIPKSNSDITYEIPAGTVVPNGATQLLAYSKNEIGEMPDCENASTTIENFVDGITYTFVHSGGRCLEATNGGDLRAEACDDSNNNQRWELIDDLNTGQEFQVRNRGTDNCIEMVFGSIMDFRVEPCSSVEFQVMRFSDPTPRPGGGNFYEVRNVSSLSPQECIRAESSGEIRPVGCADNSALNWAIFLNAETGPQLISFPFTPPQ